MNLFENLSVNKELFFGVLTKENGYIIETEQYYKNNLYNNKKLIFRFFYNKHNNLLK